MKSEDKYCGEKTTMTLAQINQIVKNIDEMLDKARDRIQAVDEICDAQYLQGRGQYPITAIVYTAFNEDEQNVPGFTIQKVKYGGKKKMYLPELFNDEMLIEVFGDTARPQTIEEVKTKMRLFGEKFRLLIFSIDKRSYVLTQLQLWKLEFDAKGDARVTDKEVLYEAG